MKIFLQRHMSSCCRGRAGRPQGESDQSRAALYLSRPTDLPESCWLGFSCNGDCSRVSPSASFLNTSQAQRVQLPVPPPPQQKKKSGTGKEERQPGLQHNGRTDGRKNFYHTAWVMTTQRWRSGGRACVFALGVSSVHLPIL